MKPVNGWRKDPFTPREENGKLYGLGSNDAGASVVTLLQVFLQLCRTQQSYNLIYLASCEEEVSGKDGIESVLKGLPPISFAIVGEPTEMQPAIAEKGLMVLDVTATGKPDMPPVTKVTMPFIKCWLTLPGFVITVLKGISLTRSCKDERYGNQCRHTAQCGSRPMYVCGGRTEQRAVF